MIKGSDFICYFHVCLKKGAEVSHVKYLIEAERLIAMAKSLGCTRAFISGALQENLYWNLQNES